MIAAAFADVAESDHREQLLVERLRRSKGFVPQLSLVATDDNERIVGYILLTKVEIVAENGASATSLAVAPLAVSPDFRNGESEAGCSKKPTEERPHSATGQLFCWATRTIILGSVTAKPLIRALHFPSTCRTSYV